jgi:hypothetical protein
MPLVRRDFNHDTTLYASTALPRLQVLRVFAYTQEGVPESPLEAVRVRRVEILYYLADGTIAVNVSDSGEPLFWRRQQQQQ